MKKVILANPRSINPARLIRDIIETKTGNRYPVFTSNQYVTNGDSILIRYANALDVGNSILDTNYNSKEFIRLCGNKFNTSQFLIEHEIDCIGFNRGNPEFYPVFLRKVINGQGGNGIVICIDSEEFDRESENNNYYWSYYLNFTSEYRIHVTGNTIARIFKKVLHPGEQEAEFPIRNMERYDFSLRSDINAFPKVTQLINKLATVFPNNFYALDIGIFEGRPIIIEINSGPGLSENTAEYYANYLIRELNIQN
jgi:hypothetical protein